MVNEKDKTILASQKKLVSYIRKRNPDLSEKNVVALLSDIKRFVVLVKKLRTEPQAKIIHKDHKIGGKTIKLDGKIVKDRFFNTDLEELEKVASEDGPIDIDTFRNLYQSLAKKKNG